MNDHSKWFVIKTTFLNNRLKMYKQYIEEAKKKGYICCSFIEAYREMDSSKKYFILRHDIDSNLKATRKMFELEKRLGVTSSYYFRDCTFDYELIQEIHDANFEVGYHYETIANLAYTNGFTKKEQIDINEARELFKSEISRFEQRAGFKTLSCASHGHVKNAELGISSNAIFEDIDPRSLSVEIEVYNEKFYDNYVDYHIMDGPLYNNYGYSYADKNPQKAFLENAKMIVFLAHPGHWYLDIKGYIGGCYKLVFGKTVYSTERYFRRILK